MRIAIWGAGAVGIGLASALARPGERVELIARDPATRDALATRGIHRSGLFGEVRVPPEQLSLWDDPARLAEEPPDWLLVCTKAFASPEVARALTPLAEHLQTTRLLLCQNGWGNEAPFLPFWPRERLFHARIITGFQRLRPADVEITAHAEPIALGSIFGIAVDELTPLAARLAEGGLPTQTCDDMQAALWAKMLYNCALNPLGALARRRYGELVDDPTTRALIEAVVEEIFAVLAWSPYAVVWPTAEDYLESFYRDLIPPTRNHESSMLQDLRAGRPTEIEALCGAVERLAGELGIETPVVSALAVLVRAAQGTPG
ncbi:MAG: 2-dehydropantoate 2-reductase [Deltaproteobacteria bacterium]|nr:2-dehydropantoate 2-reductase [Deltaproteobacteria bacterium]MBW2496162.1 2-dehydropantoate 2-reductase [Deltaproteobacteria bacterium]